MDQHRIQNLMWDFECDFDPQPVKLIAGPSCLESFSNHGSGFVFHESRDQDLKRDTSYSSSAVKPIYVNILEGARGLSRISAECDFAKCAIYHQM